MKYIHITLFLFLFNVASAQVQNDTLSESFIYEAKVVDRMPQFPGGNGELYKFIARNYKVPNVTGLIGKVFVSFVVEVDGSLSDFKILKDLGRGTGEEAIRVLKLSPLWKPGVRKDRKVRVKYELPISLFN